MQTRIMLYRSKIFLFICLNFLASTSGKSVGEPIHIAREAIIARTDDTDERKPFSLDDFISNAYKSDSFNGTWVSEKEIFYRVDELLLKFDATNQTSEILAKNSAFEDTDGLKFYLSPDHKYVLIRNQTESIYRHSSLNKYSVYNVITKSLAELAGGKELSTAVWAPKSRDGKNTALAYVLDNDIYYHQLNVDKVETRRLTFDGKLQEIYNGVPDWVYEEEVFGTDAAIWFSPTGEHLAFARFNDSQVPEATIMRYGTPGDLKNQYPQEEKFRYPKAGAQNPEVTLNVIDLADHGSSSKKLKAPFDIVGYEPILYAVTWFDAKTPVATWTNRVQNLSQIVSYNVDDFLNSQLLLTQESPGGWLISNYATTPPIKHDSYVLMLKPQPIGNASLGSFGHLTRYRLLNGVLDHEVDLTPGATWVQMLYGVNDIRHVVYFLASPIGEPTQRQLYEVNLKTPEGSAHPAPRCISCELKSPEGNACRYVGSVSFSQDLTRYALTCSGPDPSTTRIYDDGNTELYEWTGNRALRQMIAKRILPEQKDLYVESHGFDAKVRLLLPEDFDESKKYPMLVNVYAGPDSQKITDAFTVGFDTYISSSRHVIHASIDGRGSSSKGTAMMYAVYRNLGSAEVEDQITVTRKLQQMFPYIDSNRTAIWGWSYGGYSTATVLTKDVDNAFKCGISVAPVTNWIYYDSIYTERYMGLPTANDNLKSYENSTVLIRAEKLRNKKYMLVHGTGDDNVHYQQSMALGKVLSEADVLFEQVSYADEAHSLSHVTKHLYHTMDKFWSECFGYDY